MKLPDKWTATDAGLRWFNGCTATYRLDGADIGLFDEARFVEGRRGRWSIRLRKDGDCWGVPLARTTNHRSALAWARRLET